MRMRIILCRDVRCESKKGTWCLKGYRDVVTVQISADRAPDSYNCACGSCSLWFLIPIADDSQVLLHLVHYYASHTFPSLTIPSCMPWCCMGQPVLVCMVHSALNAIE